MTLNRNATVVLLFSCAAGAFLSGVWYRGRAAVPANGHRILYYVDPMHPAYTSDRPGTAPDCGMALEPVYADSQTARLHKTGGALSTNPDAVKVSGSGQPFGGLVTSAAEKTSGTHMIRLLGRVTADEGRIYKLNAGVDGYIQDVSAITTGSRVSKNQLLATFCAPGAIMAIQTYVLNIGAEERFRKSAEAGSAEGQSLPAALANIEQRRQQLKNVGMSAVQMEEIRQTREIPDRIRILAPGDGIVLARNVSPGQKFDRGAEWFRIADLSRVWIVADVYQKDAGLIRPGQRARVSLSSQPEVFTARVSDVLPQFDPETRTFKVRLEMENPGYALRPDMLVDLEFSIELAPAVVIPTDALIDSGLKKVVFVELSPGTFEPRVVETGWQHGDQVQIVSGLASGERVVTSGNFLLDSDSRLQAAKVLESRNPQVSDPARNLHDMTAGMNVPPGGHSHD
jgi:membrane fusion protein, copper/silver efflux system